MQKNVGDIMLVIIACIKITADIKTDSFEGVILTS